MLYQIEEVKVRKKKLVIIYVLILLLVLAISIWLGIVAAKAVRTEKVENDDNSQNIIESIKNTFFKIEKSDIGKNTVPEVQEYVENTNIDYYGIVEDIYNGEEGKRVFLTFDDGPSESVTPYILDILNKHNIKATFFVLGNRVASYPELVKRAYEEGHYIANHSYTHKYSKIYSSSSVVLDEYNKTEKEIQKALGLPNYSSNIFRFPGGSVGGEYDKIKKETKKVLKENNIGYLDWNALTDDANGSNTKEKIMNSLKKTVKNKNNVVVLMHDATDKQLTYETLEDVITYLKEKGYSFKNMYDLFKTEET